MNTFAQSTKRLGAAAARPPASDVPPPATGGPDGCQRAATVAGGPLKDGSPGTSFGGASSGRRPASRQANRMATTVSPSSRVKGALTRSFSRSSARRATSAPNDGRLVAAGNAARAQVSRRARAASPATGDVPPSRSDASDSQSPGATGNTADGQ